MFHSNTELLIEYWRARRIGPMAPARASVDPSEFTPLLPQIFIVGRRGFGDYGFRLAGAFLADLHGRDLREENILNLWEPEDRHPLQMALETVRRRVEPLVVDADAWPEYGLPVRIELMMAPLTGLSGDVDRMIGLYQPLSPTAVLMNRKVQSLSIRNILSGGLGEPLPHLRLAAVNGRRIA
ncbi:PAS domain-containing protein [Phenylobacterium montanum]|uniref:PAS domain-containing protein n=2 Tax=Phenylobacterium montanum TaxID=2823693 RepID=A0A975IWH7_9CAUL|nr:PAS domain-containing protein [Caulobacter sp. S6]